MSAAIDVAGLRKVYRRVRRPDRVAVDGLDLSVPEGCVFGFLGPNGSGKTTTIRCLLGLVRPSAGTVAVLGAPVPDALPDVIGRVGSIVETPQLFPTMTGRRNLALLGRLDGHGAGAVATVLDRVGLAARADALVKGYSLGMRQRLGLAAALLKDPALLILDEPANGLDPAGIREIRLLLRALGDEGRTVLVSSHLLTEVAQTCDQVAIIRRGRCVASGSVGEVLAPGGPRLLVRVDRGDAALAVLTAAGVEVEVRGEVLSVAVTPEDAAHVSRLLGEAGIWPSELRADESSLEQRFLDLTADDESGAEEREVAA
ncbi:MAG: ABC transporter ATP-binding protein [Actinomycetota bacterium]|nr:ABC transporter ATP-binding protein [Actinomycetota bacterium]